MYSYEHKMFATMIKYKISQLSTLKLGYKECKLIQLIEQYLHFLQVQKESSTTV